MMEEEGGPVSASVAEIWEREGRYIVKKCLLTLCFLAHLNLRNSNLKRKSMAEVDTAGRYIAIPLVCRGYVIPSRTLYGCIIYTNGAGVNSVCLVSRVFSGPKCADKQKQRCPAFFVCG